MKSKRLFNTANITLIFLYLIAHVCGTQFASHVSVNTPARSFTHGVGDPLPSRRGFQGFRSSRRPPARQSQRQPQRTQPRGGGYPRVKPLIPFNDEEIRGNGFNALTWPYDNQIETSIPVLPPSPYRVDSPDPESLWPEGLFLPPISASRFANIHRSDSGMTEPEIVDPYLLEGSEAIAAVQRAREHGVYYFHDIPHIESLLANQELRIQNDLQPHRVASIRQTWPYNRP